MAFNQGGNKRKAGVNACGVHIPSFLSLSRNAGKQEGVFRDALGLLFLDYPFQTGILLVD
jgi:hypothetical protein